MQRSSPPHRHRRTTVYTVDQRGGVPYELVRVVCTICGRVLDERPLRRTAA